MFNRFTDLSRIHFVGIGGAGMSGIAEILLEYDLEVSGCDMALSETTERLERLGARIEKGHSPEHLEGIELVVISSAVAEENAEVREARRRGITVVRRAEMLGELMRLKYGIAVAGTHGKTTTTSLVGTVLTEAELDPTVIVGGRLRLLGTGARLGKSDYLVAEADEFDRSFLRLTPVIAVITNVDRDHLDTYGSLEAIEDAFVEFANRVPFFGRLIVCLDDPNVQRILPRVADRRIITYGFSPQADLSAYDLEAHAGGSSFGVRLRGAGLLGRIDLGRIELPIPGRHNVRNALAAVGVGLALRIDFDTICRALAGFTGVHRRFEHLGTWQGAAVVDDYAHHPTEVEATLQAARQTFPGGRVFAVFQPHLFSRTQDQAEGFGRALLGADMAVVTDVYPSREEPIPGVTGELVVEAARRFGHRNVHYCASWKEAPEVLRGEVSAGDVVFTLGAGDVNRLAQTLVQEAAA
ncbi:MAG TPA: UDP-N-acetylmuramate--L-alanine ligase [Thermoanaerobaculia bacterium]|jgi:UDP-N-acetylmuramate--alanine ligase|nr:UDP-N-acetylmuramate--L-alanine ligase [Thermoanaerobaculia bacterium]